MIALLTENVVEIIPKHLLLLLLLSVVKSHTELFRTQMRCFWAVCSEESPARCSCARLVATGWGDGPPQPVEVFHKGEHRPHLPLRGFGEAPLAWRLQ